jgi:hypothetical protein
MLLPRSAIHVPSGCAPDRQTASSQRSVCKPNQLRLYAPPWRGSTEICVECILDGVELMLACARTRLDEAERAQIASRARLETDWPGIVRRARDHGVAALVHRALERVCPAEVPDGPRAELRAGFVAARYRSAALVGELLRAVHALEERGISTLVFKGPALAARAYGDLALRQHTDLDLLVPERSFAAAREALFGEGYRDPPADEAGMRSYAPDGDHAMSLLGPDGTAPIDLHRSLMPRSFLGQIDPREVWARHGWIELGGVRVRCLCAEDELVYLCVHGAKNWWHRLGLLCDVAEAIRCQRALDWDAVTSLARRWRVLRMLRLGVRLAADLLQAPVPGEVMQDRTVHTLAARVRDGLLPGAWTRFDDVARVRFHLALADGPRERAAHVLHVARRYAQPNALDRSTVALPRALEPAYYGVRAARLTLRAWRRVTGPP